MTARGRSPRRAGHTLPELAVAVALLSVLTSSVYRTVRAVQGTHDVTAAVATLEARGHRAMDRMLGTLRAAQAGTLWPAPVAPASAAELQFQRVEERPDGSVGLTGLERIQLDAGRGEVLWTRDLGLPGERTTTLARGVPALLEGEQADLADDNGNGLEDEPGLCFCFEGAVLVVRLTLVADGPGDAPLVRTFEGRVFRRNGS